MKQLIFIPILLFIITGCNTKNSEVDITGHIIFLHTGEEDKPVNPLTIYTCTDTTYLNYKELRESPDNYYFIDFMRGFAYADHNLQEVNEQTYKEIKDSLISFSNYNKEIKGASSGSLEVLIKDNKDSLRIDIPATKNSIKFLDQLMKIAEKDSLINAYNNFRHYRRIQEIVTRNH